MSEWLCESCRYRNGELRPYHTYDTCGTEYSYTGAMKVACTASAKYPHMVKDAVRADPYLEAEFTCLDYAKRKGRP